MSFWAATPDRGLNFVIIAIVVTVLGGMGSFIGSLVLTGLDEGIRFIPLKSAQSAGMSRMVYGTIIILTVIFLPNGILGWIKDKFSSKVMK